MRMPAVGGGGHAVGRRSGDAQGCKVQGQGDAAGRPREAAQGKVLRSRAAWGSLPRATSTRHATPHFAAQQRCRTAHNTRRVLTVQGRSLCLGSALSAKLGPCE